MTKKKKGQNGVFTRERIEELNKEKGYEAFFHPDDVTDVSTGGLHFANKEAKEKFKSAATNINPKTKEDAALVQGTLAKLVKDYEKYPDWVFAVPQEILDKLGRGERVAVGKGDWVDQNMKKYDEEQRQKRRERYLRKKNEKQQNKQ